jgi:c-di-GMP-binding flagellar brake protein YcgR
MKKQTAPRKKAQPLPEDLEVNRRREWRFDLPLPTLVEGTSPDGKTFQEKTLLENISSGGAYFCLDTGVVVGSKLDLFIDLPEKLADGKKMRLRIGGVTVRLIKPDKRSKRQGVAVRFKDEFKVVPVRKKAAKK